MKRILLILSVTFSTLTHGQSIAGKYVDISGKQRMFSQRLAKNYTLALQDANFEDFLNKVERDKISFTRQLQNLYDGAKNHNKILAKLDMERRDWLLFSQVLESDTKNINKKIADVLELSNNLLKSANSAVKEFELAMGAKSDKGVIINLAGKQRMLSQRLCLYYSSLYYYNNQEQGRPTRNNRQKVKLEVENIFNQMDSAINTFYSSKFTTLIIEKQVVTVAVLFEKLKTQREAMLDGTVNLDEIYSITNKLMFENNILTGLYAKE